ncbi:Lipoxygenase, partial [Chondrus crispus]
SETHFQDICPVPSLSLAMVGEEAAALQNGAINGHGAPADAEEDAADHLQTVQILALPRRKNDHEDVKLTFAMFAKAIETIGKELFVLANEWQGGKYERRYEYQNLNGGETPLKPVFPKHVMSLPKMEAFESSKIGALVARAHVFMRSQLPLLARLDDNPSQAFADVRYDVFKAFFGETDLFPMPRGILSEEVDFWQQDEVFADQFLNGCNPTVIEKPRDLDEVKRQMPLELRNLRAPQPDGRSVEKLLEENALFWADYKMLAVRGISKGLDQTSGAYTNSIKFDPVGEYETMTKYFYAPFVAFYKKKVSGRLGVLGIVLTRDQEAANAVYNEETCKDRPNIYTFAKMHVACADNQTHQFYYHLGRCHLTFEPFGVAVRNVFQFGEEEAQNHAVGLLLAPHFKDHMAINWLARKTLLAHGEEAIPFTDAGFALGINGGQAFLAKKYSQWNFRHQAFPKQLQLRGFNPDGSDGLNYYYRSDGMRIWKALSRYVRTTLEKFYSAATEAERNKKICDDVVLDRWCTEMRDRDRAFVRSFPAKFDDLDKLCETVTTIMYNVSAEHAAVNASQERYLSYVPNRPNALFRPVPKPGAERDMDLIKEVLGIHRMGGNDLGASLPLGFAMFQVQFCQLLTLQPTKTLMELDDLKDSCPEAYNGLMKDLEKAHYVIKARNLTIEDETPHLAPYEFLDPVQIAQSIEM